MHSLYVGIVRYKTYEEALRNGPRNFPASMVSREENEGE
jgi:hypothetical protein